MALSFIISCIQEFYINNYIVKARVYLKKKLKKKERSTLYHTVGE